MTPSSRTRLPRAASPSAAPDRSPESGGSPHVPGSPGPDSPGPALVGRNLVRRVLDRSASSRLMLGWAGVAALMLLSPAPGALPSALLALALAAIVAVIVIAAGGVFAQAEALAHRLGDPYGTLVLTLSIVVIEVVLIAAVMLGPGDHATIARDSVMAVSMIIMNLVLGLCLLVGGIRREAIRVNRTGTSVYLVLLIGLGAMAFAVPTVLGEDGAYAPVQGVAIAAMAVAVYAVFLWRQTGAQAVEFQEVELPAADESAEEPADAADASDTEDSSPGIGATLSRHRAELGLRVLLLVATVLPIVLLSHDMAGLLDEGLDRLGAPIALSGVLIAAIVFTPETLTALRAAAGGEMQRVVNLCHGALVSTLALTIPTVLIIGLATGSPVVLAESPVNLLLLGVTFAVSAVSAAAPRVTAVHGTVHLLLFAVYALALLS
ncbi:MULTISPECIES: calcium:proton antiporter [Brachybacterium]|uniref:Calcium:proton antiporter n=2 Tax=Brachybacterium TaxID=43668 RepID=A0A426SL70_9MICO|nr:MULTISPECIES: calcium:proton antiporter [Brachybacterium]RRR18965.1 calcium:proton antiporter [Brachybacterium paraconglomeratum]GLI30489.1 calcium:proton antiporter [Brachybacterium conglomeratum]GLK05003.1 calcium:proton antiporter [Brachybacterium conglomeratum]